MTAKATKHPTVKLTLQPGPVTPAQKQKEKLFWQRLIAEVKNQAIKQDGSVNTCGTN